MIPFHFSDLLNVILSFIFAAFQSSANISNAPILNLGEKINGMTLANGAADASPLWAFCASSQPSDHVTNADCRVPVLPKLAIGHVFLATDEAFAETEWSELTWELSLDGQPVNLDDFGTYDYLLPTMAPNPSLVREVFMKFTAWDVVLTNLQPGEYTLRGSVRDATDAYNWVVNLVIEDRHASE
jgi:hypothetical protein